MPKTDNPERYPSWPKGTDCKSVSCAFTGSNPVPSIKNNADIAQLVERHLGKVEVTSSNLVISSISLAFCRAFFRVLGRNFAFLSSTPCSLDIFLTSSLFFCTCRFLDGEFASKARCAGLIIACAPRGSLIFLHFYRLYRLLLPPRLFLHQRREPNAIPNHAVLVARWRVNLLIIQRNRAR